MSSDNTICSRCIMDSSDPDITFNSDGICNHCASFHKYTKKAIFGNEQERHNKFSQLIGDIKLAGKDQEYDCIIGLSGGADSSYVAYILKETGLRPLAVHVDNGWNSELAVKNIENIVKTLDIDLMTYVIDWEEFRDLQLAFLKASVVDLEMLSDNAIVVAIDRIAREKKIKYFLAGTNVATESIMPRSWFYNYKYDSLNIRSIYKRFGNGRQLQSYPLLNFAEYIRYRYFKGVNFVSFLDLVSYNKAEAIKILERELGWRDYGGKHYESKITHFYQAYILPTKFNVDKRKAFLSSLVCSGQITRGDALNSMQEDLYNPIKLQEDKEYALKKLGLTEDEFHAIMALPIKAHFDYPSYDYWDKLLRKTAKKILFRK